MLKRKTVDIQNQSGMVSIIVTMIIMIVLSLIVLGFAQIARREQRQALDRQLSNQAFYAAESGINDARKALDMPGGYLGYISGADTSDVNTRNKTHCGPDTDAASPLTSNSVGSSGEEYTCLLINQSPPTLRYDNIDTTSSNVVEIHSVNEFGVDTPLSSLTISWQDKDGGTIFRPANGFNFPPAGSTAGTWKSNTGVLEIGLTPVDSLKRQDLIDNTFTAYLYPNSPNVPDSNEVAYQSGAANQGQFVKGMCKSNNQPKYCSVVITNLNKSHYFLRLKSIYRPNSVVINGKDVGGQPVKFKDEQVIIDSTGRANDVLRRVRVTITKNTTFNNPSPQNYPDYVLESADTICKRLSVAPGFGSLGGCN